MAWNNLMAGVRARLRRSLGRQPEEQVQVTPQDLRLEQLGEAPLATPAVDVYENDREILIHADVPGGSPEDAVVGWNERQGLTLLVKNQGPVSATLEHPDYRPDDWYRAFSLPHSTDGSKATASLKDGVLTICIPKRPAAAKLIPVKAA